MHDGDAMKWTKELPTQTGIYLVRYSQGYIRPCEIVTNVFIPNDFQIIGCRLPYEKPHAFNLSRMKDVHFYGPIIGPEFVEE